MRVSHPVALNYFLNLSIIPSKPHRTVLIAARSTEGPINQKRNSGTIEMNDLHN